MKARILRQQEPLRLFVMFLVHHVESLGVSGETLRRELGLDEDWLEELPEAEVASLVPRLVKSCTGLTGDDLLCLHAGERFHFCLAGVGGLVATHAPTPELALETFGSFVGGTDLLNVQSSMAEGATTITAEVVAPWPKRIREQVLDGYFSSVVAALRAVCGSSFAPSEVRLARERPGETRDYERALRGKVTFGADRDEIVFRSDDLTKPSLLYEPVLYEQLRFIADLGAVKPSGTSPMRQLVEQAIRAGKHTIELVASTLQIKTRTLQRRLQTEDTSFRSVLNEVRVGLAVELLLETDMSLTEIARRLNYSDDKGLRKAIRHVTGRAPSQIRSERGQSDLPSAQGNTATRTRK
jgi:AraC-like DNA-binding protein